MIITIDGPAASGKSSVAKLLAEHLHMYYLYTGLLYRAFAYALLQKNGDDFIQNSSELRTITDEDLALIDSIVYEYSNGKPCVTINGQIVTEFLYSEKISQLASVVSASQKVRERFLPVQRSAAARYNIIADGRDCGTVVFPYADIKFYLTASVDVRVARIMNDEQRKQGENHESFEKLKADLGMRDHRDQNREIAPLKIPNDAFFVDNSTLSLDQTVEKFVQLIQQKIG